MSGKKINFKMRGLKQFIVLATVATQLLGATQIFASSHSMGGQTHLETKNLGVPELPNPNQLREWDSRAYYTVGDRVIYNGQIWEALVSFQGYGDLTWAPAIDSTLWTLIGDVEPDTPDEVEPEPDTPEPDTELDEEASSEGLEYNFVSNVYTRLALIEGFNGTHNNVLIPGLVMHEGQNYLVRLIQPEAFANKGIKRLEFASNSNFFSFLIGNRAFAGNPLESMHIHRAADPSFMYYLTAGMQGVTTETVLYEEGVPTQQWDGDSNWIPIN